MRYLPIPPVIAATCALLVPAAGYGQAGTRPDPDSPAGVEYQLPLEQARKNAVGPEGSKPGRGGSGRTRHGAAVRLFGVGIVARKGEDEHSRAAGGGGGQEGRGSTPSSRSSGSSGERGGSGKPVPGDQEVSRSAVAGVGSEDDAAALRIAGIALAVLLVGGLLGLGLRRGLRQTAD